MSVLTDYFLFFIDYSPNVSLSPTNNLLTLFTTAGVEWERLEGKFFRTNDVNCLICEDCGEIGKICECKIKKFFKIDIYNEDVLVYEKCYSRYLEMNLNLTKRGFIVLKSNTTSTQFDLTNLTRVLSDTPTDFDLFYLCKWLDKMELTETIKTYEENNLRVIKTFNPLGFQAVIVNNKTMEKLKAFSRDIVCKPFSLTILNLIKEGELKAYSTFPTLFNFDILSSNTVYKAKCNEDALYDYLKNCEFQGSLFPEEPLTRRFSSDITFFWIFIVCLIVFISFCVFNTLKKK